MRQNSSQLQILLEYTHSLSSENFFSTQLFSLDISPSPLTFRKKNSQNLSNFNKRVHHHYKRRCRCKAGRHVVATKNVKVLFGISCSRLNYQPLFGKMSPHSSPRRSSWTRAISFVGFSQSCYRLQIFVWQGLSHKLSDQNKVVKMADNVDKMNLAFERVLECFKLQNLKDSQREALQNLVKGQDVFVIQPTGSGKSLIFQSAPIVFDTVRPLTNAKSIALVISPLASLMQGRVYKG